MTPEERYKSYKLEGLLNSKKRYLEEHPNAKIKGTIAETFKRQFNISDAEYDGFRKKYSDIQAIKSKCTKEREKGFGGIIAFYDWYKKQQQVCSYCRISQKELYKIFRAKDKNKKLPLNDAIKRSSGTLEIERIDSNNNEYNEKNCILACPLCNNAKSNLIDEDNWVSLFVSPMRKYYEKRLGKKLENHL